MVTVLDEGKYGTAYLKMVQENRIQYAQKHGMFISGSCLV